jgi:hypothetical protein
MTEQVCDAKECTFAQTGVCMQSYSNPEDCPSHQSALVRISSDFQPEKDESESDGKDSLIAVNQLADGVGGAVLPAPEDKVQLPRSGTLGLSEADLLMASRYTTLVGIVGLPNAGKTACIASLYLLLAHGSLKGLSYSDSKTLMALEEIVRGTRRWNDGSPPLQMTVHTELAEDRQAGFLHLRLRRDADGRKFDILMPDLPGEWSDKLILHGEGDRFAFLKAAEVLWLMVDGRDFLDGKARELAIHRTTNLIERLAVVLPTPRPRIILVTSWRDKGQLPEAALERVRSFGASFGFNVESAPIASFSDTGISPGFGLVELVETTLSGSATQPIPWPVNQSPRSDRAFLNFGRHG